MAERLIDQYPLGTRVEIKLADAIWVAGVVAHHQFPAVWVRTRDGRSWFVTNGTRIRPLPAGNEEAAA